MSTNEFLQKWRTRIPPAARHEFAGDLAAIDRGLDAAIAKKCNAIAQKIRKHFPDDPLTADSVCRIIFGKRPD